MKHWSPAIKAFLAIFIFYEVLGWLFVGSFERIDQLQLINGNNSSLADLAFQALTATAEVVLPVLLLVYLFRFQKAYALPYVYSYALSTGLIQGLKHLVFTDALRPLAFFAGSGVKWHLIPGLLISEYNSMPSGHTGAAFFMFFWVAVLLRRWFWGALAGLMAVGVAYSRVYLFQHFPVDTLVGAAIGVGSSALFYSIHYAKSSSK
ncbi:phosphatase PAP2 family protein [Aquirufa sp. HETE-83D]|uniref:Phosphatase PAP2 family protein n=1 Tax=Aquirufa esocilacus TaxID=3096513 RepID=A0ABW6DMD7_9BACT